MNAQDQIAHRAGQTGAYTLPNAVAVDRVVNNRFVVYMTSDQKAFAGRGTDRLMT